MSQELALGNFVDRSTIRFELRYPHPRSAVWEALTDPAALAVWFLPMEVEHRIGGRVVLMYRAERTEVPAEGTVTALEAPSLLELTFESGPWAWPSGFLRFELSDDGPGASLLVFTQHVGPDAVWPEGQIGGPGTLHPGAAAGWQLFFEPGLRRHLDGTGAVDIDLEEPLMAELEKEYARRFDAAPERPDTE